MSQINSSELRQRFGQIMRDVQREPVEILSHGKPAAVLVSAHEYERLRVRARQVVLAGSFDDETVKRLQAAEAPPEAVEFDHEVE
jgi:prevent-host-death family protein